MIQEGLGAAFKHKPVKQFLIDLARARLAEMERKAKNAEKPGATRMDRKVPKPKFNAPVLKPLAY